MCNLGLGLLPAIQASLKTTGGVKKVDADTGCGTWRALCYLVQDRTYLQARDTFYTTLPNYLEEFSATKSNGSPSGLFAEGWKTKTLLER
jgi:hypothetical protein